MVPWQCSRLTHFWVVKNYFKFPGMAFQTNPCTLALLAHVVCCNIWSSFWSRSNDALFPPPERKPNANENRNNSNMFGALRSPPPAANRNRSSSTAHCDECLMLPWLRDKIFPAACESVKMGSGLLHSQQLRGELSAYTIYDCRCISFWCTINID
jgi:hypothetical protein